MEKYFEWSPFAPTLSWFRLSDRLGNREFLKASRIRQTEDSIKLRMSQNRKWADKKQLKTICKTTNVCVEIITSKLQVMENLVTWYKFAFAVWRKRDA